MEAQQMQGVYRVKLYRLDTRDGSWDDRGTGQISVAYLQHSDAMGLIIVSDCPDDPKTMLIHKLSKDDMYRRQDATIICWSDKELNTDVAVSFEKAAGCDQVWAQIQQARMEIAKAEAAAAEFDAMPEDWDDAVQVPMPEIANLEDLAKTVCSATPQNRERMAGAMLRVGWIPALLDVFKQCEDLEDVPSLGNVFKIVRGAIMLNEPGLLEELLKEENVMDVVGALEQDPELGAPQRYRSFLSTSVVFKEVVPIREPALLAKIHQTYRIQYIKDVILPRSLDDSTYAALSSLALFNNVEVVSALSGDPDFLSQLFAALERADPGGEEWADLVAFLQEFCNLARHLQQNTRQALFAKLVQLGLFDQVTRIMSVGTETTKLRATDVLLSIMQHDTAALRTFLMQQHDHQLWKLLVHEFTQGVGDGGLCEQVSELLKLLLDPDTLKDKPEKSEFVEVFYDKFMDHIVDVITTDKTINPKEGARNVSASTLGLVVDFCCFCVTQHSFRMKYFILRNLTLQKVVSVLRRPERWLACAAIRFVRTCVNTKDAFYAHHLMKNNLFEPVMACFFQNGDRYNLLNSATLELIDYITRENVKDLIKHLVQLYARRFEEVDYVDTFEKLIQRYSQHVDAEAEQAAAAANAAEGSGASGAGTGSGDSGEGGPLKNKTFTFDNGEPTGTRVGGGRGTGAGARRKWDDRQLSRDEEDYFDGEDEEAGSTTGSGDDAPGLLPMPEGPYPRPRSRSAEVSSPPGSPKRGRPVAFSGGPQPKRRAQGNSALPLSIFTPSTLGGERDVGGDVKAGEGRNAVDGSGSGLNQVWLGLTEYEDEDGTGEQGNGNVEGEGAQGRSDLLPTDTSPAGPRMGGGPADVSGVVSKTGSGDAGPGGGGGVGISGTSADGVSAAT